MYLGVHEDEKINLIVMPEEHFADSTQDIPQLVIDIHCFLEEQTG
jgi:hypothetical protein